MRNNLFIRFLCSIPVILVLLYFIPFLGICLILFRYYVYRNKKIYLTSIYLLISGLIVLIPKLVNFILNRLNIKNISYLNTFFASKFYKSLVPYSKLLITLGIISLILSVIFKNIYDKLKSKVNNTINSYVKESAKNDAIISEKNDLLMKEKREKALNTHVVKCPYCGSNNMLVQQTGICSYCRKPLEYKKTNKL